MRCNNIMTKHVKCVHEYSSAKNALKLMHDSDCGVMPVINDMGKLVGIVTDRDIAIYVGQVDQRPADIQMIDFMTKPVITCHADDDMDVAIDKMRTYKVRRIPIVDDEHKVVGLISLGDIAVLAHEEHETFEALEEISTPISIDK